MASGAEGKRFATKPAWCVAHGAGHLAQQWSSSGAEVFRQSSLVAMLEVSRCSGLVGTIHTQFRYPDSDPLRFTLSPFAFLWQLRDDRELPAYLVVFSVGVTLRASAGTTAPISIVAIDRDCCSGWATADDDQVGFVDADGSDTTDGTFAGRLGFAAGGVL